MKHRHSHNRTLGLNKEKKKFLGVCAGIADYLEVEPWSVRLVFLASVLFGGWFLIPLYFIAWFCLDDKSSEGVASLADSQPLKHFRTVDYKKKLYRNTEDAKFLGVCAGVADYLEVNVFAVRLVFLALVFFAAAFPLFLYFGAYFILEEKPHRRARSDKSRARHKRREERRRRRQQEEGEEGDVFTKDFGSELGAAVEEGISAAFSEMENAFSSTKEERPGRRRKASAFADDADQAEEITDYEEESEEESYDMRRYSKRREFKYCARKFAALQDRLNRMEAFVTSSQFKLHREFKNI